MCFIISHVPTSAYQRLPQPLPVLKTLDDLLRLQDQIECDLYISLPDEYGQRRVMVMDPM
jgi:hypothetical protein